MGVVVRRRWRLPGVGFPGRGDIQYLERGQRGWNGFNRWKWAWRKLYIYAVKAWNGLAVLVADSICMARVHGKEYARLKPAAAVYGRGLFAMTSTIPVAPRVEVKGLFWEAINCSGRNTTNMALAQI